MINLETKLNLTNFNTKQLQRRQQSSTTLSTTHDRDTHTEYMNHLEWKHPRQWKTISWATDAARRLTLSVTYHWFLNAPTQLLELRILLTLQHHTPKRKLSRNIRFQTVSDKPATHTPLTHTHIIQSTPKTSASQSTVGISPQFTTPITKTLGPEGFGLWF